MSDMPSSKRQCINKGCTDAKCEGGTLIWTGIVATYKGFEFAVTPEGCIDLRCSRRADNPRPLVCMSVGSMYMIPKPAVTPDALDILIRLNPRWSL